MVTKLLNDTNKILENNCEIQTLFIMLSFIHHIKDVNCMLSNLLLFNFLELINLVSHFIVGVLSLLSQCSHLSFTLHGGLFKVSSELQQFLFSLLVEFHLSSSGTPGFVETFAEFLELPVDFIPLFLNLNLKEFVCS